MTAPRTGEPYFTVGLAKLALLTVCSFGVYQIYWFYQQWKREVERTGEDLQVVPRAIFTPIFAYSLFRRVHQLAADGQPAGFSGPGGLAVAYVMILFAVRLPDPFWLAATLSFLPLLPIQAAANGINQRVAPAAPRNDLFSLANVAMIVIGAFMGLGVIAAAADGPGLTEGPHIVASSDGLSQLTVLDDWRKGINLHEEAEIQVVAPVKNAFAIVLTEPKDDFSKGFTYADHAELTFDKLVNGIEEAEIVRGPDSLQINGRRAVQYEAIGTVRSLRIVYIHTTVDGQESFHQIIAWTTASRIERNRGDLETVIASFSETP